MFRATMSPSSGEITVFMQHLVLVILYGWLVCGVEWTLHIRQSSVQNKKYQLSHKYDCFSWWWAHSHLKHVEKRNKHTKKNCAPSWLYLQYLCFVLSWSWVETSEPRCRTHEYPYLCPRHTVAATNLIFFLCILPYKIDAEISTSNNLNPWYIVSYSLLNLMMASE